MTDQEINEAVARKLGDKDRLVVAGSYSDSPDTWIPIPDYCHSIAAAWEIVEKFPMQIGGIMRVGTWYEPIVAGRTREDLRADTAPMAICLAFLKLP